MAQDKSFDLHDLYQRVLLEARATWHYRWHALIVAWCAAIVGALLVFGMPSQYTVSAQVYADTEALMNPLLHGLAVQTDVRGRLKLMTQTLLSRPNLETVADKTGLALRATTPAETDALLTRLGSAVKINDGGARNLYDISYADSDPRMAQKVVQAFVEIFMNDTLGADTASMQTAQSFLKQQVHDYNGRLNAAEAKIAAFKKANAAYLPSRQTGATDYFTRLQAAKDDLQTLQARRAHPGDAGSAVISQQDPRLQQIDKQITAYQQQLNNLLLRYTNAYPDVVSVRRMLGQLKTRREALRTGHGDSDMAGAPAATPAHRASRASIQQSLTAQIAAKQQEIATLEQGMSKASDAQTSLQQLGRNYDITKKQYDELVTRLNTAQLSQDATQSGNNLKFRVISPPIAPPSPTSPNRSVLLWVVFGLALLIGAAFAYFMHKIRPVFASLQGLRDFVDVPVLGSFGLIVSLALRRRRRREIAGFCTGVALLALVVIGGVVFDASLAHLVQHAFAMGVA
jgi:polysaccharide chain length determinant protein (PEP-CTERM system associated)